MFEGWIHVPPAGVLQQRKCLFGKIIIRHIQLKKYCTPLGVSLLNIYNNVDTFAYLGYVKVNTTSVLTKQIAQFKQVNYEIHHSGRKYCFVSVLFVFSSVLRVFRGFLKSLCISHPGSHGTPGHLKLSLPSSLFFFFFFNLFLIDLPSSHPIVRHCTKYSCLSYVYSALGFFTYCFPSMFGSSPVRFVDLLAECLFSHSHPVILVVEF